MTLGADLVPRNSRRAVILLPTTTTLDEETAMGQQGKGSMRGAVAEPPRYHVVAAMSAWPESIET